MSDRDRILRAVDRLADALAELSYTDRISITPAVRLFMAPNEPTTEEARHLHAIGFTPELAELLAETVEQLLIDRARTAEFVGAAHDYAFAAMRPELVNDIDSAFAGLDLTELTRTVLDDTAPQDRMAVTRALDAMFGDHATEDEDDQEDEG